MRLPKTLVKKRVKERMILRWLSSAMIRSKKNGEIHLAGVFRNESGSTSSDRS